ncbi:hypothetical protein K435DRAFT_809984, partial [Dendrothele bispora CBS 962.96]
RIAVWDSWEATHSQNQCKPLRSQQHVPILLAVMWVAELIAQVRGESLVLANNPTSEWDFEPHAKTNFQVNGADCGVHVLWHLKRLIEADAVDAVLGDIELEATGDLIGKRLKLAEEIIRDVGLNVKGV